MFWKHQSFQVGNLHSPKKLSVSWFHGRQASCYDKDSVGKIDVVNGNSLPFGGRRFSIRRRANELIINTNIDYLQKLSIGIYFFVTAKKQLRNRELI